MMKSDAPLWAIAAILYLMLLAQCSAVHEIDQLTYAVRNID